MEMDDEVIKTRAIEFAKINKKKIARNITDVSEYVPDLIPISVYMAGSPGAGKTEFSKNLIAIFEKQQNQY